MSAIAVLPSTMIGRAGQAVDERGARVLRAAVVEPGDGVCSAQSVRARPIAVAASSGLKVTSGSSISTRRSNCPLRAASRNASTRSFCRARSAGGALGSACTRRRARLASCRVAAALRPTIGAISSNGTANMSCSTNASRSAGARVSSTTSNASPTESASTASCAGSIGSICSGRSSSGSSRRAVRERSASRQIRPTTVVSQAPRLSSSAASTRPSRSHASCTASSASADEPSIRVATACNLGRSASKRSASVSTIFFSVPVTSRCWVPS